MCDHRHSLHCILPPHVVEHMAGSDDPKVRKLAFECIPNHAFFLVACNLGGKAWTRAGAIWCATLRKLTRFSQFQEAADTTYEVATNKYGASSKERKAVKAAWKAVGIHV